MSLNTSRDAMGGCWNSNCSFRFWWRINLVPYQLAATESWNGTSWTTVCNSGLNTVE
jgi:hypothetical protein